MSRLDWLNDWIEEVTVRTNVIASWTLLNYTYKELGFTDVIPDQQRIDEYKTVIQMFNKFLAEVKTKMIKANDLEGLKQTLLAEYEPKNTVKERTQVVFQKMKFNWLNLNTRYVDQLLKGN